jgi:hypothetical protein
MSNVEVQASLNSLLVEWLISILEIIFLHYVARYFCETIKLPKEMPKIAKCLKCLKCLIRRRRTIDFIFIKNKKTNFVIISTC